MKQKYAAIGRQGEYAAWQFLQQRGYRLLVSNYRAGRWGEIDLVCTCGRDLVFVEVKTRSNTAYGLPIEAVTRAKLAKLRRAAEYFLLGYPNVSTWRLDVVCVYRETEAAEFYCQLYTNVQW